MAEKPLRFRIRRQIALDRLDSKEMGSRRRAHKRIADNGLPTSHRHLQIQDEGLRALKDDPRAAMRQLMETKLQEMLRKVDTPHFQAITGLQQDTALDVFRDFEGGLKSRMDAWPKPPFPDPVFQRLWDARMISDAKLDDLVKFWLQHHVVNRKLVDRPLVSQRLRKLSDLREPFEWFTEARKIHRKIHLHIGPTNSGKTYHALQRLEKADSGLYAGPLRLLAHEVYHRMNAAGRACTLKTGDERLEPVAPVQRGAPPLLSCTVEMTPLEEIFDVAVIDEIQMLADEQRGFAWTKALLGLQAREIHLCGEERTRWLVEKITQGLGDELEVHRYNRLSPLKVQNTCLEGDWNGLRAGDCVVAFEIKLLHALRSHIENKTKKRVAIVYGALPPEVRAQQAALFNDPDSGYDILVASDAVGMGLNLNIKRVIFYNVTKKIDGKVLTIEDSHLKQIAGRAGRFKVAPLTASPLAGDNREDAASLLTSSHAEDMAPASTPKTQTTSPSSSGFVTTLMSSDLGSLKKAMTRSVPNLTMAYIQPPDQIFYQFASLLPPDTPFSYLLYRFVITAQTHPLFQTGVWKDAIEVSDLLQEIPGLSMKDRLTFVFAPANARKHEMIPIIRELAQRIGESRPVPLLELRRLRLELLDREGSASLEYVKELEILHKALVLYNWLSYRYEALFETRATAFHIKVLVEKRIDQALFELGAEFRSKLGRQLKRRQWKEDHETTPYREEIPQSEDSDPKQNMGHHLASADEGWPNDAPSEAVPLFDTPEHTSAISSNP